MSEHPRDQRDTAGAFGFTRREAIVLGCVMAVGIALGMYQSWQRSRNQTPAWTVESIVNREHETAQAKSRVQTAPAQAAPAQAEGVSASSRIIDINIASEPELVRLPGIGAELARRIIADREEHGPFRNSGDLMRVRGIGPKRAAQLAALVRFGASPPAQDTFDLP